MGDLKPCPFCGETPGPDAHYQNQGYKWGGIQCCCEGPEVRTDYQDWPAWREKAVDAWNERATERQAAEKMRERCMAAVNLVERHPHHRSGEAQYALQQAIAAIRALSVEDE